MGSLPPRIGGGRGVTRWSVVCDALRTRGPGPHVWAIVDGKLYLVPNSYWLAQWRERAKEYKKRADVDWHVVEDLPAPGRGREYRRQGGSGMKSGMAFGHIFSSFSIPAVLYQ